MNSLGDIIVDSLNDFLIRLFEPVTRFISENSSNLVRLVVSTPRPNSVFTSPTNGPWPDIYTYYWETMVPLSLLLWGLSLGLVIFLESTSHLFSGYHRTKLKKRAFSGLLGILSWWWLAALSLRFMDGLAGFLVPSLSEISFFETLSFGAMGVLGLTLASTIDITLFLVIGVLYLMRQLVLYLFVLLMPLLIVFWIPGVGPFRLVSQFMKRLAGFYVPFLFMTIPVALLFRLGQLLGESASISMAGFGQWLLAIIVPLVAVVAPFVLFWQAGALFFMADRAAQHSSRQRARNRMERAREAGREVRTGVRNLGRGIRDSPAIRADGQQVFGSGSSRTHAVGSTLNSGGSALRSRFGDGATGTSEGDDTSDTDRSASTARAESFDNLRDSDSSKTDDDEADDDASDDRPRYIQ